ncbi:hypothetical protein VQ01_11270 [Tamlana sp. s12]|nr:hypothetical protein VQ01_11270 [Tamlana sp. s12]
MAGTIPPLTLKIRIKQEAIHPSTLRVENKKASRTNSSKLDLTKGLHIPQHSVLKNKKSHLQIQVNLI